MYHSGWMLLAWSYAVGFCPSGSTGDRPVACGERSVTWVTKSRKIWQWESESLVKALPPVLPYDADRERRWNKRRNSLCIGVRL